MSDSALSWPVNRLPMSVGTAIRTRPLPVASQGAFHRGSMGKDGVAQQRASAEPRLLRVECREENHFLSLQRNRRVAVCPKRRARFEAPNLGNRKAAFAC